MGIRRANRALLAAHVAVSVAVFGMELVLAALGVSGAGGTDPRQVYPAAHLMAQWLMQPLALASLLTGLLLVGTTGWSLRRHWWVAVKLAVSALLTVLVFALLTPGLARMADAAVGTGEPITRAAQLRFVLIPAVGAVALASLVALGVVKPGRRGRTPRRPAGPVASPRDTGVAAGAPGPGSAP